MEKDRHDKDELAGVLVGLAKACLNNPYPEGTTRVLVRAAAVLGNFQAEETEIRAQTDRVKEQKDRVVPNCRYCASPCGNTSDYDMKEMWEAEEGVLTGKFLLLSSVCHLAGWLEQAGMAEEAPAQIRDYLYRNLARIGYDLEEENLLQAAAEAGKIARECREWLDGQA
jgi:hydroxylamine reductase